MTDAKYSVGEEPVNAATDLARRAGQYALAQAKEEGLEVVHVAVLLLTEGNEAGIGYFRPGGLTMEGLLADLLNHTMHVAHAAGIQVDVIQAEQILKQPPA